MYTCVSLSLQIWFAFVNGFSGQILFERWCIGLYNVVSVCMCVIYCERECVKAAPLSCRGKKLISCGSPSGSFTAALCHRHPENFHVIYEPMSSPYSPCAQNYVLNALQQQPLMPLKELP